MRTEGQALVHLLVLASLRGLIIRGPMVASEHGFRPRARLAGRRGARPARAPPATDLPPPRLLGALDPVLLGWRSRAPILGGHQGIVTVSGSFRPFALIRGRAGAPWSMREGQITLAPFGPLTGPDREALEADASEVERSWRRASAGLSGERRPLI